MSNKFTNIIDECYDKLLVEAPGDMPPPVDGEVPPVDPAGGAPAPVDAAPVDQPPVEEEPDGDVDALKIQMTDLVRKALLINREEIQPEDYARLATSVTGTNVDQMNELVNSIINSSSQDTGISASKLATS